LVNTEKLGSESSRFQTAVALAVGPLLQELGSKLSSDAGLEILQKLTNLPPLEATPDPVSLLELVDASIASSLASDVATATGLTVLAENLTAAERDLAQMLAQRASSHMNTLERLPHVATEAAQAIIALDTSSLTRGVLARAFADAMKVVSEKWAEKERQLENLEKISLVDFQSFRDDRTEKATSCALHCLASALENLRAIATSSVFPTPEAYERPRDSSTGMQSVGAFERKRYSIFQLIESVEELKSERHTTKARGLIARGKHFAALSELEQGLGKISETIRLLRSLEPAPSTNPRQGRFLEAENYAYVQCLARHLLIAGESPRNVEKLVEALFEYAGSNNASVSELIDEEILKLNPSIKRESLAKSRLEVRLNDRNFPLSVNHKEWIVQATKLFIKEKTNGSGNRNS
jgi:hypothetical protein